MSNATENTMPPTEDDGESNREFPRRSVLWPGKIRIGRHEFPCQVWNVSLGGAKVRVDLPLKEGTDLTLVIPARSIEMPARIAWQSGDLLGIVFIIPSEHIRKIFGESVRMLGLDAEGETSE